MKKKLLAILLVAVLSLGAVLLVACNNDKLTAEQLDELVDYLQISQNQIIPGKTATFEVSATVRTYVGNEQVACDVEWSVSGSDKVSVAKSDDGKTYTIKIPALRTDALNFQVIATLVNAKGKAYTKENGDKYQASWTLNLAANSTATDNELLKHYLPDTISNPEMNKEYNLSIYLAQLDYVHYFKGTTSSDSKGNVFLDTSDKLADSVKVKLESATGGFYITFMDGSVKKYINFKDSTTSSDNNGKATIEIGTTGKTVFHLADDYSNILVATVTCGNNVGNQDFYLGSHGTYDTISATSTYYIEGSNASKMDVYGEQYVARLVGDGDYNQYGGKPDAPETGADVGSVTAPKTVAEALVDAAKLGSDEVSTSYYYVQGVISKITYTGSATSSWSFEMKDAGGTDIITCQFIYLSDGMTTINEGDTVIVYGRLMNYQGKKLEITAQSNDLVKAKLVKIVSQAEVPEAPELGEAAATFDFSTKDSNVAMVGSTQKTASKDGITLTNNKSSSTSAVTTDNDNKNGQFRCYKGSTLTVEYTSAMTSIRITCESTSYAGGYTSKKIDGASIVVDGKVVIITFDSAQTSFTTDDLGAQMRIEKLEVFTA